MVRVDARNSGFRTAKGQNGEGHALAESRRHREFFVVLEERSETPPAIDGAFSSNARERATLRLRRLSEAQSGFP
jgi:hypothetical protein